MDAPESTVPVFTRVTGLRSTVTAVDDQQVAQGCVGVAAFDRISQSGCIEITFQLRSTR